MAPDRTTAVIDLGSNSFRMVVYSWGRGRWRRTDEIFEAVRVSAGIGEDGALTEEAMGRALATIDVFAHFAHASGIPAADQAFVATSAIRDATNREEFLVRAREVAGTDVRVLSGEEEARYGYLAAVNSTTLADGAVLDLGGGSMQLVHVADREEREASSWPLGAVRMTERFLADGEPATAKQLAALHDHVIEQLGAASDWLPSTERLVGLGGTIRTLAAAIQRAADLPSWGVQGTMIATRELDALIERLAALPARERASIPGIKYQRADLVLAGAVVVRAAMEACGVGSLEVTEAGLREGVLFERMLGEDALVDDVRRSSVLNLAAHHLPETDHTRHVAVLALGLFDELAAAGLHDGDPRERELLWAAAVLHDIGMAVDYDDHHKHTRYLILSGGLPGYSPREVALIAQITRFHRKGMPGFGELAPLMEKGDQALLDRCALLLRLAEDLERPRDQSVREAHARVENGTVRLELVADGEARVSRWAASREEALFERAFGRHFEVA